MASAFDFPMPQAPVMDKATATDRYAKFVAAPFQSGFGHTIGNALRRVLLSSLEGSAICAVRIDGTTHEFSSLPNVIEDVTEIILNLKKVCLNLNSDQHKVLEIRKSVAGPVTAADIVNDGSVEIYNPEQIICTLDKDVPFRAEIEIAKGRGWCPAERNKHDQPLGTIHVDCLFSPVTHVRYQVSATRVEEKTEMDSLTLEIYTDGRITPQDALKKAAMILSDHLSPFFQGNEKPASPGLTESEQKMLKLLSQDVETLDLSVRAMNCLNTANIKLLGELCLKNESRMLKYRNFGRKSLDEIKEKLAAQSLQLAMPLSENLQAAILAEAERVKAAKTKEEE